MPVHCKNFQLMNPVPTTFKLDEPEPSGIGVDALEQSQLESAEGSLALIAIDALNSEFEKRFEPAFLLDSSLTRPLVSFQANKARAVYRWFKYKEAFSAGLIEHFLAQYKIGRGILLDLLCVGGEAVRAVRGARLGCGGAELLPAR